MPVKSRTRAASADQREPGIIPQPVPTGAASLQGTHPGAPAASYPAASSCSGEHHHIYKEQAAVST